MHTGDEVDSPATGNATPPPTRMSEIVLPCAPTPASVLRSIAAAGSEAWFPSRYAAETGLDRDSLDEPLGALRLAGLVRVETWVRGLGQGYVLTPEGRDAAASGAGVPRAADETAELPPIPPPGEPDQVGATGLEQRAGVKLGLDTRPPLIVPLLLVVNVLCFAIGLVAAVRGGYSVTTYLGRGYPYLLHRLGAVSGEDLLQGQWWRLFTSCFVHVGALHLVMNLMTLAIVGLLAELLWGRLRLAVIYLVSGLAGGCLAAANQPDATLAGASGAILGLLGSQVAWLLLFRRKLPPDVSADWVRTVSILLVLNAGVSFVPGVSWEAHLGGFVAGFVTACLLHAVRTRAGWRRWLAGAALVAIPAASVGGLAAAVKWSGKWEPQRQRFAAKQEQAARNAERARHDAAQERQAQVAAARQAYLKDVGPHLDRLAPQAVTPVEEGAKFQLLRTGERRKAAIAEARAEVDKLKASADAVVNHPDGPAVESESFDQFRSRARQFAQARSRSLALLLKMLDAPGAPDEAAWAAWNESRRAANELWNALGRP